jgi:hypothetical protein
MFNPVMTDKKQQVLARPKQSKVDCLLANGT